MSDRNDHDPLPRLRATALQGNGLHREALDELRALRRRTAGELTVRFRDRGLADPDTAVTELIIGTWHPRELPTRDRLLYELAERLAQIGDVRLLHDIRPGALAGTLQHEPFSLTAVLTETGRNRLAYAGEAALLRLAASLQVVVRDGANPTVNELRALVVRGRGATLIPGGQRSIVADDVMLRRWSRIAWPDGRQLIVARGTARRRRDAFFID